MTVAWCADHGLRSSVHHMDLYRLNMDVSSLARLQIPELFKENICLIEWANKLLDYNDLHGIIDPSKVPMLLIHINYMTMRQHHLEDEDSEPRLVQISTQHPLWANRLTNPKINPWTFIGNLHIQQKNSHKQKASWRRVRHQVKPLESGIRLKS